MRQARVEQQWEKEPNNQTNTWADGSNIHPASPTFTGLRRPCGTRYLQYVHHLLAISKSSACARYHGAGLLHVPFPCRCSSQGAPPLDAALHHTLHPAHAPATSSQAPSSPNSHGVNRGSSVSWRPRFALMTFFSSSPVATPRRLCTIISGIAA